MMGENFGPIHFPPRHPWLLPQAERGGTDEHELYQEMHFNYGFEAPPLSTSDS